MKVENEEYRERLREILADEEPSGSERVEAILRIGAQWLGVENSHLTKIDLVEGTHRIVAVSGAHPKVSPEVETDVSRTYCRRVLTKNGTFALHNAPEQGWADDPAFEAFGLPTYLGTQVVASGELYGTLCFVDRAPRQEPFTESDAAAAALIAQTIGQELERRDREDRLQETQSRLEALFGNFPDIIYYIHDLSGNLLLPNPHLQERTGFDAETLGQMKAWDLDVSIDPAEAKERWAEMEPGDRHRRKGQYRHEDGSTFPVELDVRRVELEGDPRFIVTAQDITQRYQTRRRLERYREYTDRLLDASEDLFLVLDTDGTLDRWNEGVASVTGYSEEELDGMNALALVAEADRERTRSAIQEAFSTGRSKLEARLLTKAGASIPFEFTGNRVEHPDGDFRAVAIGRDITDRKRHEQQLIEAREEAKESSRLRAAMMANMSHEIRTPLTSIMGFTELLSETVEGQAAEYADRIRRSGKRLMKTLDSVLELSRLEAGALEIEREKIRLDEIAEDVADLFRTSAEQKSLNLTVETPEESVRGFWNEGALIQITKNLLDNAIKFTPDGGHVWVRVRKDSEAAVLEIEDTGVGIRSGVLSDVFEAFRQESEGLDREYEGTGLGLSIVDRLTQALGGTIDVYSEKGVGSRFVIRFPYQEVQGKENDAQRSERSPRKKVRKEEVSSPDAQPEITNRHAQAPPRVGNGGRPRSEEVESQNLEASVFRRMYEITADHEANIEDKTARLIDLGQTYLGLPYGFLTRISEETQEILVASGDHPLIQSGETCPLSEAYCRKTIQEDSLLSIHNAPARGWVGDPAYQRFGLGAYIGSKVIVGGEVYGTFCFAAPEPRETAFSEWEETFVELLTRWASYEIERRQDREQMQQSKEQLEEFAGAVTHDLRNPLNVAQGRLSLVLEEMKDDASREAEDEEGVLDHLQRTHRALQRMETLIEDLLAFTWGEQELSAERLEDLSLQATAESAWTQVETPDATLRMEGDLRLRAHKGRLCELLENLFRNALEHGSEAATVTVGTLSKGDRPEGFYVEDDGPGIPVEKREQVLERGYSSEQQGTGLGLSIVATIAEAHGWTLSVCEGRTGGARFEFRDVESTG